jgi:opacity protein-like surface antigen
MTRLATGVVSVALLLSPVAEAAADWAIGGDAGYQDITNARNSAKAVFGSSSGGFTGGGLLRYGFGPSWFVAAGGRYFSRKGERVFVPPDKSAVFKLGHPLTLSVVPVYGLIGYRFSPNSRFDPYLAIGGGATKHTEKSTVAGITETDTQTKASGNLVGGVEYGLGNVRIAGELMYSIVPDSLGLGGVSKVYGEKDIGGLSVVGRLIFTPGH